MQTQFIELTRRILYKDNMRHLFQSAGRIVEKLDKRLALLLSLLLIACLGWLDFATGFEISFSFFYLLPISLAAWTLGPKHTNLVTTLSVLTWLYTNWLAGQKYSSEWIRFFNVGVRWAVFLFIANILIELKEALQIERNYARRDFLTGITSKREFFGQLVIELHRAEQIKYPISFGYIDLDNFKKVNDEFGHSKGDEQLRLITNTITGMIRKTDCFARLGGDEFGLFLPNVDQKNAQQIFEKVKDATMEKLREVNSPITLSAGVITFLVPPHSVDEMLHEADSLMYRAKALGKNQVFYKTLEISGR